MTYNCCPMCVQCSSSLPMHAFTLGTKLQVSSFIQSSDNCYHVTCVDVRMESSGYILVNSLHFSRHPASDLVPSSDSGAWWILSYLRPDLDHPGEDPVCGCLQPSH